MSLQNKCLRGGTIGNTDQIHIHNPVEVGAYIKIGIYAGISLVDWYAKRWPAFGFAKDRYFWRGKPRSAK